MVHALDELLPETLSHVVEMMSRAQQNINELGAASGSEDCWDRAKGSTRCSSTEAGDEDSEGYLGGSVFNNSE